MISITQAWETYLVRPCSIARSFLMTNKGQFRSLLSSLCLFSCFSFSLSLYHLNLLERHERNKPMIPKTGFFFIVWLKSLYISLLACFSVLLSKRVCNFLSLWSSPKFQKYVFFSHSSTFSPISCSGVCWTQTWHSPGKPLCDRTLKQSRRAMPSTCTPSFSFRLGSWFWTLILRFVLFSCF